MAQFLDIAAQILWFGGLPLAAIVAIMTYVRTEASKLRKLLVSGLFFLAVFSFSYVLSVSIFFRDGLAPGFVPSEGWLALSRTAGGFLLSVLVGAIFAIIGVWVARGSSQSAGAA